MRHAPRTRSFLTLALVPAVAMACADAPPDEAGAAAAAEAPAVAGTPHVVDVRGMDFAFEAPDRIASGWVTFRFSDEGPEPHHLVVMRLEDGHTFDDLATALTDHRPHTGIATALGGPNAPGPGGESNATMYLEPGDYALVCVIPSPDGVPHFAKGMMRPITVTAEQADAPEPTADVTVNMVDFAYQLSAPITAGERTLHVVTDADATEPHDILLIRFEEGKGMRDFGQWMATMDGPPPARFLGGTSVLDPGHSVYITADFGPGDYAMICPIPSHDGQTHAEKGMVHLFTIE